MRSLLPIVKASDNFPPHPFSPYPTHSPDGRERYVPFHLTFADFQAGLSPIGLLRPAILAELQIEENGDGDSGSPGSPWQSYWTARASSTSYRKAEVEDADAMQTDEDEEFELEVHCVFFADWVIQSGGEAMHRVLQETVERWKAEGNFKQQLDGEVLADPSGWRNEQYQIYASPQSSYFSSSSTLSISSKEAFSNAVFTLERAACALFGFATFGVHMTAYEGNGADMKLWIPRRSRTKPTFPGMLDNTVAGGIPAGMTPLESMIKECEEEASLPAEFVRNRLRAAGVITYFFITKDGWLQPELEYIYDLPLPAPDSAEYIRPRPFDDEVESFSLLSVDETLSAMHAAEFKPNCGSVIVDFMIRHGMVTAETEPNYLEIRWSLARRLGLAVPAVHG